MKKKLIFGAIAISMLALFGACGKTTEVQEKPQIQEEQKVTPAEENKNEEKPNNNKVEKNNWWEAEATPNPEKTQGEIIKPEDETQPETNVEADSIYAKLDVPTSRKFTTYVFSITGDPADLTLKPDGIFYGENYELRGRESEKPIHLDVWNPDGELILSQNCGIRIYGAYSRRNFLKSIKLYARESYDPENKTFKYNFFDKIKLDGTDKVMKKYKKLVLRNSGNDYQFAWIRDELNQTLAKDAGFEIYESVAPAIYYINGEYKGFYWLHESYDDKYFKELYGEEGKEGEFVVCEGGEQEKKEDDEDELTVKAAKEYNKAYTEFSKMDLTVDANYQKLNSFMDVENYLKYMAYNIYLCNKDWPDNNYKCFRYYAPAGEAYDAEGVYDGRWRFLLHDMDYTMGLYGHTECMANYDNLGDLMSPTTKDENEKVIDNKRYAPLLTALLQREDCKQFFVDFSLKLAEETLSKSHIAKVLEEMNDERLEEIDEFYNYLAVLRAKGDGDIWVWREQFDNATKDIGQWAKQRANYSKRYMEKDLGVTIE
ncbi:MAG: CotH kinase family protein [Lachnospiraceae bacterium]|nr:CotH kinase family protein [Lachnospiraceae bacterium]